MRPRRRPSAAALLPGGVAALLVAGVIAAGCADPGAEVEARRAAHKASVSGWVVREEPTAGAVTTSAEAPSPVRQDVELGIMVRRTADAGLPGLTLDVTQDDANAVAKASFRAWVDTAALRSGTDGEMTHRLENVDYAPGDRFRVAVRTPIPAAERGGYREFGTAAP